MGHISARLTILFEALFWIALYEREENETYEVCKVTFGSEPKDYEVYAFFLKHWKTLRFSPQSRAEKKAVHGNPKRLQREIRKQLSPSGIGTKAQQALKRQQELDKTQRKSRKRQTKQTEKQLRFERKQEKKKEKRRGR